MEPLARSLFSLYRGTPRHEQWVSACLSGAWPRLLGGNIAAACRPDTLEHRILTVVITDPAWEETLKSMAGELLGRIRSVTGDDVRRLRFAARPDHND